VSKSLRIVIDARATSSHFPGVARATLGLLSGLHQLDHPHAIMVVAHGSFPAAGLPCFNDPRFTRISTSSSALSVDQQWRLPTLARRYRPDLWHAPYYVRPLFGIPRPVVTIFDVIGRVVPGALPSRWARFLFELLLRLSLCSAAHVITSSEATKRDLITAYRVTAKAISVIPLAVDERFRPQPSVRIEQVRERYHLPQRYLLYLGSNKPHKNIPTLVQAFAQVQTNASLVIAGHWDQRFEEPKRMVEALRLSERVRFLHDVTDTDIPTLLSGALAFVFPSRYEGFGLPPLEAMACGVPVIAANTGSLPEVIGDAGLLIEPEVISLERAIQRMLEDTALRQDLAQRSLWQASQFSWVETARATVAVYEEVADRTRV
jgi:glycosyltransferase involved in cell wall biosynthesis